MERKGLGQRMTRPIVQHDKHGHHQGQQANQGTDQRGSQAQSRAFGVLARRASWLIPATPCEKVLLTSRLAPWGRRACCGFAKTLLWLGALFRRPLAGPAIVGIGLGPGTERCNRARPLGQLRGSGRGVGVHGKGEGTGSATLPAAVRAGEGRSGTAR